MVDIRGKQLEVAINSIVNNKPLGVGFTPLLPEQAQLLKEWDSFMGTNEDKNILSRANPILYMKVFALFVNKPFELITRKDIEDFFNSKDLEIKEHTRGHQFRGFQHLSPMTQGLYKSAMKTFYKWMYNTYKLEDEKLIAKKDEEDIYGRGEYPPIISWVKVKMPKLGNIEKSEVLSWTDTQKMIDGTDSIYQKCLIALLRETGARANELLNIKIKDVDIGNVDAVIKIPNSKVKRTGGNCRKVLVVDAIKYLRMWLQEHPKKDNPDCWLFINMNTRNKEVPEQMGYAGLYQAVTKVATKVFGNSKKFNPHWFRHSAITETSSELTDAEQRERYGWVKYSPMIGRYNHLTSEDVVDKQRLGRGIKIKEVQIGNRIKKVVVKECPNCCEENNMSINEFCWKCHFNLNKKVAGIDVIGKMQQEYQKLKEDNELLKNEFAIYKILINDTNKSKSL